MPLGRHYCCLLGGTTVAPPEVTLLLLEDQEGFEPLLFGADELR